jgi:hypothetical protein
MAKPQQENGKHHIAVYRATDVSLVSQPAIRCNHLPRSIPSSIPIDRSSSMHHLCAISMPPTSTCALCNCTGPFHTDDYAARGLDTRSKRVLGLFARQMARQWCSMRIDERLGGRRVQLWISCYDFAYEMGLVLGR